MPQEWIVTHAGKANTDEWLAIALLTASNEDITNIIRSDSLDWKVIENDEHVWVVDIKAPEGSPLRIDDPSRRIFNHHFSRFPSVTSEVLDYLGISKRIIKVPDLRGFKATELNVYDMFPSLKALDAVESGGVMELAKLFRVGVNDLTSMRSLIESLFLSCINGMVEITQVSFPVNVELIRNMGIEFLRKFENISKDLESVIENSYVVKTRIGRIICVKQAFCGNKSTPLLLRRILHGRWFDDGTGGRVREFYPCVIVERFKSCAVWIDDELDLEVDYKKYFEASSISEAIRILEDSAYFFTE